MTLAAAGGKGTSMRLHSCAVRRLALVLASPCFVASGCADVDSRPEGESPSGAAKAETSWEEFRRAHSAVIDGRELLLVEDDMLVSEDKLRAIYDAEQRASDSGDDERALVVNRVDGADDLRQNSRRVTYCFSDGWGTKHGSYTAPALAGVQSSIEGAMRAWEAAGNLRFVHRADLDGSDCNTDGDRPDDLEFVVTHYSDANVAIGPFPSNAWKDQKLLVPTSGISVRLAVHEVGHALGFRHEHTHSKSGLSGGKYCDEATNKRDLTTYDANSAMAYADCKTSQNIVGSMPTDSDLRGARKVYGAGYQAFRDQRGTGLHETGDNWHFEMADNGDLFAIAKSGTGSGMTEVHVLSADSGYQEFSLHAETGLGMVGDNVDFALSSDRDLYVIVKNSTGTATTEVHALSAASNYGDFFIHTGTALHETDGQWEFELADNSDLYAINRQGASGTTEVHVLSADSDYQEFSLHTATALHPTDANWEFLLAGDGDLFAVAKTGTGTGTTELHVLAASSNYGEFNLHTGTALHETNEAWSFVLAPDLDVVAIAERGTGTSSTELHVLWH